ncbi:MAG: glycosyltransferase [Paludibacter sp.]
MKKTLSVIIVTYNSERLIFDCLDSIFQFNNIGHSLEVIIVDNNSNDQENVFESIRNKYPKDDVKLIKNPINGGYGNGNNIGVLHSTAEYIIIMNPDVRIIYPIFQNIISRFKNNRKIGMLGVTFADNSCPLYFKPEYITLFNIFFFKIYVNLHLFNMKKMYMSGSFLIFPKKIFIDAGSFDENIFLFYEEADISNRILKINKNLVLAHDIEVYHLTHDRNYNERLASYELKSLLYYSSKYRLDHKKIINTYLLNFKIKYFVAYITNNSFKKELFLNWIKLISNNHKNNNLK